ncbi:unnamed protein product [Peniophora sp. CBMAI 1063]|nr:unnamed protein product [Peniophora sp. CBMAI 1063]
MRKDFADIQITLVEYANMTDRQQRQLFQALQMGQRLTAGQKLHGALRTPRKRLAEAVFELYDAQFIDTFGVRKNSGPTLELLVIRVVHMILSRKRTFKITKALLNWVSSDDTVTDQAEDRVWESMALAFSALSMPSARLAGERKGHYMLAPVEIIAVVLFAEDMYEADRYTHGEHARMASGIKELRIRLRRKFPGVLRSNCQVLEYAMSRSKFWMRTHPRQDAASVEKNEVKPTKLSSNQGNQEDACGERQKAPSLTIKEMGVVIDLTHM